MKYIIDIEDEYTKDWVNETPMCKELCIPISVPNRQRTYHVITGFKLEPYTEPDREAIENETWDLANRIADMSYEDFISCFEGETEEYVHGLPYHEVKCRYEAWKKGIRVGDEVEQISANGTPVGYKCVVTKIVDDEILKGITQTGEVVTCSSQVKKWWRKTGRHFEEVERLLERMRGK